MLTEDIIYMYYIYQPKNDLTFWELGQNVKKWPKSDFKRPPVTMKLKFKVRKQWRSWHCPYILPFKLSRPKGNLCGGGMTVLNPKYPQLSSGDAINGKLISCLWSWCVVFMMIIPTKQMHFHCLSPVCHFCHWEST